MREFQLHLLKERKLAVETVAQRITALRFFLVKVLKRRYEELDLVYPKLPQRLPTILSEEEVTKLIESASEDQSILLTGLLKRLIFAGRFS
jgi:site-specific recombinase XerD